MMAPINLGPARVTAAAFWAMTLATISTTAMTATSGAKGAVRVTALGKFWFRAAPNTTGTSTTWHNHRDKKMKTKRKKFANVNEYCGQRLLV